MKLKNLLLLLLTASLSPAFAEDYLIKLHSSDEEIKETLYLVKVKGLQFVTVDSAQATNGHYEFHISEEKAYKAMYKLQMYTEPVSVLDVVMNKENVEINIEGANLQSASFSNSTENTNYQNFVTNYAPTIQLFGSLQATLLQYPKTDDFFPVLNAEYNRVQQLKNELVQEHTSKPSLFSSEIILSELNIEISPNIPTNLQHRFMELNHFDNIDFHNEDLIKTEILPKKVFQYFNIVGLGSKPAKEQARMARELVKKLMYKAQDSFAWTKFLSEMFQSMFKTSLPNIYYFTKGAYDFSNITPQALQLGETVSVGELTKEDALYKLSYVFSSESPNYPETIAFLSELEKKNSNVKTFLFNMENEGYRHYDLKSSKVIPTKTIEVKRSFKSEMAKNLGAYRLPLFIVTNKMNEVTYLTDSLEELKEFTKININ